MPRKREGYTQVPFEMPDGLLAAARAAADEAGEKLTVWICTACATRAGVRYDPPRLGRPPGPDPAAARGAAGRAKKR